MVLKRVCSWNSGSSCFIFEVGASWIICSLSFIFQLCSDLSLESLYFHSSILRLPEPVSDFLFVLMATLSGHPHIKLWGPLESCLFFPLSISLDFTSCLHMFLSLTASFSFLLSQFWLDPDSFAFPSFLTDLMIFSAYACQSLLHFCWNNLTI